ncbi:MAG: hypothetical protein K0R81_3371 [Microbacterium sp.]|nr:hypothetical protein [Microbacterium sp.]
MADADVLRDPFRAAIAECPGDAIVAEVESLLLESIEREGQRRRGCVTHDQPRTPRDPADRKGTDLQRRAAPPPAAHPRQALRRFCASTIVG